MNTGKLIIFSAPSGSGKSTIVNYLLEQGVPVAFSISACSRAPRGEEKHGEHYYFLSPEEFRAKVAVDDFLEWEEVYEGRYYGTLRSEVERIWAKGKQVIFDIDVVGGVNIKEMFPVETLSVFVMPPSLEILQKRLIKRGDISNDEIETRIKKAENELDFASKFDNIIINSDLNESKKIAFTLIKEFIENE